MPGSASGREGGGRGRVGGDEQAPLAGLPRPGLGSAALGARRRGVRGALSGRARNATGEGARQPRGRAPSAEKWSPGSPAAGARSPGTSQRWNPRNAGLPELLRQAGQKSCTFNGLALERVFLPRWGAVDGRKVPGVRQKWRGGGDPRQPSCATLRGRMGKRKGKDRPS